MKPLLFSCSATVALAPEIIARRILDVDNWIDFKGYGLIPGIRMAEFAIRTPNIVGSQIRVTNTDGSTHIEEIIEWQSDRRVRLLMKDFSAPLSRLASGFQETWEFERLGNETKISRSFEIHPKSILARPLLWILVFFLKRAITRHLQQMQGHHEQREL